MSILRKELKQLLNDKAALLSTLLLPFISTMILGFALANTFGSQAELDNVSIAIVESSGLDEDISVALDELAVDEELLRQTAVPDSLFANIDEEIGVDYFSDSEEFIEEDYTAVIAIPAAYRYNVWLEQFGIESEREAEPFDVLLNSEQPREAIIVETMLNSYLEQVYVHAVLDEEEERSQNFGEVVVQGESPITSFEYYTYGMGVVYVFFTAGLMANFAFSEKKKKVYGRLLLANIQPVSYLFAKFVTSFFIVLLQLMVLFALSMLIFQLTVSQWGSFLAVIVVLCLSVASVASLLVAVTFRANSEKAANVFMLLIVSVLAFLGGSFFPTSDLSPVLAEIGRFTPNGHALQALIQSGQGATIDDVTGTLFYLSGFAVMLFVIAWIVFPSKGGTVK
ncbi:ABC transporter permease [Alkalihalobacillus sp. LMS6]|uniref:ABC transporter permease n=1 Tax=Alkalihalobacillus sp. LMS6 TaxID=2924034 RepID=UPI0020D1B105|nr:ABC transporter permease [Alkalihalobacillus sp. LMS6]UTR07496.1 ABC transporter permease [Alkalihalobacillus sp. LMS6]